MGIEPVQRSHENLATPVSGGAKSGAFPTKSGPIDPDPQRLIDAWPKLPEAFRVGILAMIDTARK
jgi:hypothetical protein